MNRSILLLTVCLLGLLLVGCKNAQQGGRKKVKLREIEYEYFSSKAKAKYIDSETNLAFSASFRMKSGDTIWVSLTKAGFPVAKALFTQDSVFFVNKFERYYSIYSYDQISRLAKTQLSFTQVEDLILGNLLFDQNKDDVKSKIDEIILLTQLRSGFKIENKISPTLMKINEVNVTHQQRPEKLVVTYDDFEKLSPGQFATKMSLKASFSEKEKEQETSIDLKHTKPKFGKAHLKMPFKIPSSYARK